VRKKLKLIPAAKVNPKAITIFDGSANPGPFAHVEGSDDPEHVCGACGKVLLIGMQPGQFTGIVSAL
jgi:hypothetical protein